MASRFLLRLSDRHNPKVPLRFILVVPFVLQLFATVGVIGYLSFKNSQQSVEILTMQLTARESDRIEQELATYLATPHLINQLNVNAVQLGQIDVQDLPKLEMRLFDQLTQFTQVGSVMFANANGPFRSANRLGNSANLIDVGVGDFAKQAVVDTYEADPQGKKTVFIKRYTGVDVRRDRPWYRQAITSGKPGWSPTFQLDTNQVNTKDILAITAYSPLYDPQTNSQVGVFATSVSLNQISQLLKSLAKDPLKEIFVVEPDGSLIASSADSSPFQSVDSAQKTSFDRLKPDASQSPLIRETSEYLKKQAANWIGIQTDQIFKMKQGTDSYLINIRAFHDQYGLDWHVVTIVPDSTFMTSLRKNARTTLLFCLAAMIASSVLSLYLAQWIIRPLRRLNRTAKSIAQGELETQVKSSAIAEVDELTDSFQQMTTQLRTSLIALENYNQRLAEQFDVFFRCAPAGMAILDDQMHYLQVNEQLAAINGLSVEAHLGRTVQELMPDLASVVQPLFHSVLETGQPILSREISAEVPKHPGVKGYWLVSYFLLPPTQMDLAAQPGNHSSMVGIVVSEISERKRVEDERNRVKAALSESEAKFSTVFYAIPDPAWIATLAEGRCLNVNDSMSRFFGYSRPEMIGRTCQELGLWGDSNDLHRFRQILVQEGSIQGLEVKLCTRSGECKTVLLSARRSSVNSQDCVIGVLKDITERKQIETALQESEIKNRAILQAIPDLIVCINREGIYQGYIRTNALIDLIPEFCDPVGRHISDFLPAEQAVRQVKSIQQALETGQIQMYEQTQILDNRIQYEEVRVSPYGKDETLFMIRDITQRKQLEIALQASEARLNGILNQALAAIISYRIYGNRQYVLSQHFSEEGYNIDDWHYEFCSAGCEQVFGYSPAEFTSDLLFWYEHVYSEDWETVLLPRYRRIFSEQTSTDEYRFLHRDGTWHWISETATTRWDEASQSWVVILVSYDVSDRKQVELELQQAKEEAEAANRAKSIFLANMSHELRTPLNAILGFTELLSADSSLNQEQQENLGIVHSSGEHLLNLINDILDLSKIEAGRVILNETNINLYAFLQSLRDMFASPATDKRLQLILEFSEGVPKFIAVDAQKLRQVLINLLGNAVKFTRSGKIVLRVTAIDHDTISNSSLDTSSDQRFENDQNKPEDWIHLYFEVEDTGIGIAPEEQETIFDAFAQAQAGRQTSEGTGLGLAISRKFIRLMGSELKVNSILGKGSNFHFHLAVRNVVGLDETAETLPLSVIGLVEGQPTYRILVVDDQPVNRHLLSRLLSRVGLEVQEAADGKTALQLWKAWRPHLIWMDLRMPDLNGYEITQRIRKAEDQQRADDQRNLADAMEHPAKTIIVALTAHAFKDAHERAIAAGCDDVITKPVQESVIFQKMAEHLGLQYRYVEAMHRLGRSPVIAGNSTSEFSSSLQPVDLQVMPEQWIAELHKAALTCYTQDIDALITQIPPEYSTLIAELKRLNYEYQYETIIQLSRSQL